MTRKKPKPKRDPLAAVKLTTMKLEGPGFIPFYWKDRTEIRPYAVLEDGFVICICRSRSLARAIAKLGGGK